MTPDQVKLELLHKLTEWAMPYSPFTDNSLDRIKNEMTATMQTLNENTIGALAEIGMSEDIKDEEFYYTYLDLIFIYFKHYNTELMRRWLSEKLEQATVFPIATMIGYTREPKLYPVLEKKIIFSDLSTDDKFHVLDAIGFLHNNSAVSYLKKIQAAETDPEIINDIEICIDRLT